MSYCRFSDGDVYAYESCYGGIQFYVNADKDKPLEDHVCKTYSEAYQYIKYLSEKRGLNVPTYAIEALREDAMKEVKRLNPQLLTLVHDLFSALQALCDANECEYCILACEPYDQCPIDGLRRRVKECE